MYIYIHIRICIHIYIYNIKYIYVCNDLLDDGCELWLPVCLGIWVKPKLLMIPIKSLFNFAKPETKPPPPHS